MLGFSGGELAVESPYSGECVARVRLATRGEQSAVLERASAAQQAVWSAQRGDWEAGLAERQAWCERFVQAAESHAEEIARLLTQQMGKPLQQSRNEVAGMAHRARTMIAIAKQCLAPAEPRDPRLPFYAANHGRRIVKEPVGVVLAIAPWNYPLLTAVNCLVPAVLAGNAVVVKHSPRTPLCGDVLAACFRLAGAPDGLVQSLHCPDADLHAVVQHPAVQFVNFTGSVDTGHKVYRAVAEQRFIDCGLELGGKDAAYVAADADPAAAAAALVDGAMYNAGQSCCAVERVYVHQSLYDKFVDAAVAEASAAYVLGDPLAAATNMGPLTLPQAPAFLHRQVTDAVAGGARLLCGGAPTTDASGRGRFFAPTVLSNCGQQLDIMQTESFGPVLPIQPVASDAEAVSRINDSAYGLTAAVYTADAARADIIGAQLRVGTVFMNRCDAVDPLLPWGGHKDTGKGASLSEHGFKGLVRLKGYNFRV